MGDAEQNKTLRNPNVKLSSELLGVFFWFNSLNVSMALARSFAHWGLWLGMQSPAAVDRNGRI